MNILLVGKGKMANAIATTCAVRGINCIHAKEKVDYDMPLHPVVAVHFGSGSQLLELIDLCERMQIPLIQGSTKLKVPIPIDRNVVIINAPNLSLPMIRFLGAFQAFAEAIKPGMEARIVESHQSTKVDKSGTARALAGALGIAESEIKSVRDPAIQLALGVPEGHLGGHAYHYFLFNGQEIEIGISTKIHGRATYAEGALALAQVLANEEEPWENGIYELKDILHMIPK